MTRLRTQSLEPPRSLVYGLAALPVIDCVLDQLNNTFHPALGPLSLLQIINGTLMLIFVGALLWAFLRESTSLLSIPLPVPLALLMLLVACTEELVSTGSLSMESAVPYLQMLYWVLLWAVVAVLLWRNREHTDILLRGLAAGAVATAISVFLGFVFGTTQYYESDAVDSSAGWFDTAKMITGLLITGGIILLYLGRTRHRVACALLAWLCFTACILTYARAGWVAAGAVLIWFAVWAMLFGTRSRRRWLIPFLSLTLLIGAIVPAAVGTDKLMSRWADVGQGDQAGSGRAAFWKIAFHQYVEATPARQAFGRGYSAMADMLLRGYGMDIRHTHNDLLDMLTVSGLCGAVWLLTLVVTLFWQVFRCSILSVEGAAGMAIVLTYVLHGALTGQLWGTGVMVYYTLALACLYNNARATAAVPSSAVEIPVSQGFVLEKNL